MSDCAIDTLVTFVINNKYPNGVEFEITENFGSGYFTIYCKECKKLDLNWEKHFTPEMLTMAQTGAIAEIRKQLVEHAKGHNELVKALVKKYVVPCPKSPYPNKEALKVTDEELMKIFKPVLAPQDYEMLFKEIQDELEEKKKEPKEEGKTGRRISLGDEE